MPNPLSRVRPDAGYGLAAVGTYPLRENEQLARLAMECISSWADVECNMLRLYLTLAGGAAADAAAVFLSLENASAKKAAITALVDRKLTDEGHKRLFHAISKVVDRRYKERNRLAHWVWGYSQQLPDCLLLADPKSLAMAEAQSPDELQKSLSEHIFVYRESDFAQILAGNEKAAEYAFLFNWIVQGHPANAGGELWTKLCAEHELSDILNPPGRTHQTPP